MSIVKDQIEDHIEKNNLRKHNQTGFTKGGRKEDNLFVLQHLVEKCYKQDKQLVVISIDYSKAYDSIDRKKMIETMIKYKIHPDIIDIVSNVYQDDYTNLVFWRTGRKNKYYKWYKTRMYRINYSIQANYI